MTALTPKQIVQELNRYIIGQEDAKRAVAIALRNRWRRKKVKNKILRDEILPKNILMIGPTGIGKTEISRRISKLCGAPFLKVEATKFTEVGYVGRDVESIIRDLTQFSVQMVRQNLRKEVEIKAKKMAEERLLDALVGSTASKDTREKFRELLHQEKLHSKEVEIEVQDNFSGPASSSFDIPGLPGGQMGVLNISDIISKALGGARMKTKRMTVADAHALLMTEESDKLIDEDRIVKEAIELVENEGIVFLDELDKVAGRGDFKGGEVSREGVQRDLLPLLEGSTVVTKYGPVCTEHILFIGSGAFHMAKPSDLLPELQGRLPIRVELKALTQHDFERILKEPETSLLKQYAALLATEKVKLLFQESGIKEIAKIAAEVNANVENIGARRLHTVMERLLDEISFGANELKNKTIKIDAKYVQNKLNSLAKNADLSKFIL